MNKVEFLSQVPLFNYLVADELADLAQIAEEYEYPAQSIVAYQRDIADSLYIVRSGLLIAYEVDNAGIIQQEWQYPQNSWFRDIWLFVTDTHNATVRAVEDSHLLIISRQRFVNFLKKHPDVLENLDLSEEGWEEADKMLLAQQPSRRYSSAKLLPDELIEYESRRSRWLLGIKLAFPTFGLVVVPLLLTILTGGILAAMGTTIAFLIYSLVVLFFLAWLGYQWLDWLNDYFMITDKHIIHHEFSLSPRSFGSRVHKIPIDQVQSVEIEKPNLLANIFNIGTARITMAAAASVLYFDFIDNPRIVETTINELTRRVKDLGAGQLQASMRQSVENHFNVSTPYRRLDQDDLPPLPQSENDSLNFIQKLLYGVRYRIEEDNVISYRKHIFVLFKQIAIPLAILAAIIITTALLPQFMPELGITGLLVLLGLLDFIWLIWQTEDWRNDTFQVTDRYVIDIDRLPFGFGESRKQAELGNVQNVNVNKQGLLPSIFNYGDVVIDTAGATADIIFERVADPGRIQSDIFTHRDQYKRKQQKQQTAQRRREYAVLLDVYEQAKEQRRIPQRTPKLD